MSASNQKVQDMVLEEHGWEKGAFSVKPFKAIKMPPCDFFSVTHKTKPIHDAPVYGVASGGQVISQSDEKAVDKILKLCTGADQASADTWAEVLTKFHWSVGPGTVLYKKEQAELEVTSMEQAGRTFAAPQIKTDKSAVKIHFFLMNFETGKLYEVSATLQNKNLEVEKKPIN